jgi:hypothetical protein
MALVHTVVLQPRAVIADAFRRFRQRPWPLWAVGALTQLPNLRPSQSRMPTDLEGLQLYAQQANAAELQSQILGSVKWGLVSLALSALAWPVVALLTQGVAVEELWGLAAHRILVAAKACVVAIGALLGVSALLMLPTLIGFIMSHHYGDPWVAVPGLEAMGFWLVALCDTLLTLLLVSLALGALIVVPAEACARPDDARPVLEKSWRMCRDYLAPITGLLTWLVVLGLGVGLVTDTLETSGFVGRLSSWAVQGALAAIPPLCGASLHKTLSDNADAQKVANTPLMPA